MRPATQVSAKRSHSSVSGVCSSASKVYGSAVREQCLVADAGCCSQVSTIRGLCCTQSSLQRCALHSLKALRRDSRDRGCTMLTWHMGPWGLPDASGLLSLLSPHCPGRPARRWGQRGRRLRGSIETNEQGGGCKVREGNGHRLRMQTLPKSSKNLVFQCHVCLILYLSNKDKCNGSVLRYQCCWQLQPCCGKQGKSCNIRKHATLLEVC